MTAIEAINNIKRAIMKELCIPLCEPIIIYINGILIGLKQKINHMLMYIYLIYYTERIRRSRKFMLSEALKRLQESDRITNDKLDEYQREIKWN